MLPLTLPQKEAQKPFSENFLTTGWCFECSTYCITALWWLKKEIEEEEEEEEEEEDAKF